MSTHKADNVSRMQKIIAGALAVAGVSKHDTILVAVSGGADSMALLHALHALGGYSVAAGHVEHGLRGEASLEDMRFVQQWCDEQNIPCHTRLVDVPALRQSGVSLEAAAREARYGALRDMMREAGAKWLAVAHHQGDQAETLLLHLLRGSGHGGLCGMRLRSGDVLRPLLEVSKADIVAYCAACGIGFREDQTNSDTAFARNRIRGELIPYIEAHFNPSFALSASRLCFTAAMDEDYLRDAARQAYDACVEAHPYPTLSLPAFGQLPPAMQYRVVRRALCDCIGEAWVEFVHVRQTCMLAQSGAGSSINLPKGWHALRNYDTIRIMRGFAAGAYCVPLVIGGQTRTPCGVFSAEVQASQLEPSSPLTQYFDADAFPENACVRTRRPGERVRLLGMDGEKKLQDILVDAKIPRHLRDAWPLVAADKLLWITGIRRSQQAKTDAQTARWLRLSFAPTDELAQFFPM